MYQRLTHNVPVGRIVVGRCGIKFLGGISAHEQMFDTCQHHICKFIDAATQVWFVHHVRRATVRIINCIIFKLRFNWLTRPFPLHQVCTLRVTARVFWGELRVPLSVTCIQRWGQWWICSWSHQCVMWAFFLCLYAYTKKIPKTVDGDASDASGCTECGISLCLLLVVLGQPRKVLYTIIHYLPTTMSNDISSSK